MIRLAPSGVDMFRGGHNVLVCPVNTVGVMGAGLAKVFKEKFPEIVGEYKWSCRWGFLSIGETVFVRLAKPSGHRDVEYVALLPTKRDWRDPSTVEIVGKGLGTFWARLGFIQKGIGQGTHPQPHLNVGMPALGCGLGGLSFEVVLNLVGRSCPCCIAKNESNIRVTLYRPWEV